MPPPGVGANLSSPAAAVAISGVDMDEKVDSVVGESSGRVMKSAAERIPESHARRPRASPAAPTAEQACPSMKSLHLEEAVISGGELLHKEVEPETDVDKQRLRWEAVDEERQVWDAMDEQHKFKKKEEKMQKKEERRQKQDKKRKRKLDVEVMSKELEDRRKKSAKIQEPKMVRAEGGGSSLAKKLSQRPTRSPLARLPLVSSPGVNMLKSGLGVLASAAASKRRRSLSERDESSPSQKKSKSAVRSPSTSRSPSPRTSILRGSKRIHSHGRKIRRLTSAVWRDFNPRYDDGKLVEAECKHCNEVFPAGRDVGTSGAQRHLATCKIRSDLNLIVQKLKSSVSSPHASVLKNWEFDPKLSRQLLARMIVLDEMPFLIVEYSGFVDFVKSLNPLFKMVSRNTIKDDCMKLFNKKRSAYCEGFKNYAGRVSLTSDMWTSNQTLGYICITIHFIDVNWKLHKKIIRFCMLETPHNGVAMFNVLLKSLQEWNLEDKLFSITVDNAYVNGTMIDNLRENLVGKNMLLYEGALLHVRCACHVFNLIAQVGLLAVKSAIDNIRESVKYIKSSQTRLDNFIEVVGRVGISCKLPSVDVSTRWNSTYLMLESAFPFRKAFHTLGKEDTNYKFCPSSTEWTRAKTVCSMLKTFYTATQVVSGSTYPTSNLYFHEVWNVKLLLEKEASRKDEESRKDGVINAMVDQMQNKFDKYWLESYLANSIPVILDPRFKYDFIKFRLKQAFGSDVAAHLGKVEAAIRGLFMEYSQLSKSLNESTQEHIDEVVMKENDPLADWDLHQSKNQCQPTNELDIYLQEETFPRKDDFNILEWWALHSSKFPVLSQIARDVLAVPASVVPSESAFSTGQRVISDYRSRLNSSTVEALICLQDWLKHFESLADIVDDNDL